MRRLALVFLVAVFVVAGAVYLSQREQSEPTGSAIPELQVEPEAPKEPSLEVRPESVRQGDPALVIVENADTSTLRSITFNGKPLGVFEQGGKPAAMIGIDLRMQTGSYPLVLTFEDGETLRRSVQVTARTIAKVPLGIPEELGGNTPESERQLINTLVEEGRIINSIPSSHQKLWTGGFRYPVDNPVVTDTYGYSRLTGASTISHKGTDFRAAVGTPVYAMNSGLVRFASSMRNYGNTIVIDHGLGLHTIYMHLSELGVGVGQTVEKGELIGKSGATGYVIGAHLHLSVRIGGTSIDPEKFMEIFGER